MHAQELLQLQASLSRNQLSEEAEAQTWEIKEAIKEWVSGDLIGSMQTLDDAFSIAQELENSEVNSVFKLLAQMFIPSDERLKFLNLELDKHQNKLILFNKEFGDKAWRQQIPIQRTSHEV